MASSKPFYGQMLGKKANKSIDKQVFKESRIPLFTCLLFALFVLTSCLSLPDPESSQDFNHDQVVAIPTGQSAGQTFVSRRARLTSIDLWFDDDSSGVVRVELFHQIDNSESIYTRNLQVSGGRTRIQLPSLNDPAQQSYYLRLSTRQGEVSLLGRNEDAYPYGSATHNGQTIDADLAFRSSYTYDATSAWDDIQGMLSLSWLLLPLGLVLFLPGWLLLDLRGRSSEFDIGERIAISLGLSLAAIPLLMLWTSLVGLRWGRISLWVVVGALIALVVWRRLKKPSNAEHQAKTENAQRQSNLDDLQTIPPPETHYQSLITHLQSTFIFRHAAIIILILIFGLTLFTRFAMVRDQAAPPWVDPIHHGLITRLMMESGGIPDSYAPHLPSGADYYHFGFHSSLSSFIWLSGLEIQQAALVFGQVLNALMVFAIYLLAKTLTQNRSAALAAALISGLFTLMPAYYVSWGRYTQLAGLLILPVALALVSKILKIPDFSSVPKKDWLLTALACGGLFLVHYRVAAFFALLVIAYGLAQVNPSQWLKAIGKLAILSLLSALLILPWLPGTIADLLVPKGQLWNGGEASFSQIPWNFLKPGLGEAALVLAGIGLFFGLILLKRFTITVLLWTGLIYLLANLGVLGLPGSGFVNPVSVEITLFMPISILGGFAIGGMLELLDKFVPLRWQFWPRLVLVALGAWGAILGAQRLIPTLNPVTFLAREADFPAIAWINEHIPEDETLLLNPTAWGYGLYMGNDGGYWISPLTGRQTMPPPVLYGLGDLDEIGEVNRIIEKVRPIGEDAAALWQLMQVEDIGYVYLGARGGIISPQALAESELFSPLYHQEGVWVFEAVDRTP